MRSVDVVFVVWVVGEFFKLSANNQPKDSKKVPASMVLGLLGIHMTRNHSMKIKACMPQGSGDPLHSPALPSW